MKVMARITAYRISNGALAGAELPTRLKVLDWGANRTAPKVGLSVLVGARTARQLPLTQAHEGWDRIALDFEHNTLRGTPEYERSQEPRAVAAYGIPLVVNGDGLYLTDLQWTPHGKQFAREYVDLSPSPVQDAAGEVIGLHSVALCRHGAVDGLNFYSVDIPSKQEAAMDWKKWLCGLLGVSEDTADDALQAAFTDKIKALCVEAVGTAVAAVEEKLVALKIPADPAETITALSTEVSALKTRAAEYDAQIAKRDRNDVLNQAARDGKVVALSADAVEKLSLDDLKAHVKALPVTVPLDRRTPENIQALSTEAAAVGAVETVAKMCGLDPKKVAAQK